VLRRHCRRVARSIARFDVVTTEGRTTIEATTSSEVRVRRGERHSGAPLSADGAGDDDVEAHLRRAHEIASVQSSTFFLADIERDLAALGVA
jgi:hypothetical protein